MNKSLTFIKLSSHLEKFDLSQSEENETAVLQELFHFSKVTTLSTLVACKVDQKFAN